MCSGSKRAADEEVRDFCLLVASHGCPCKTKWDARSCIVRPIFVVQTTLPSTAFGFIPMSLHVLS